MSLPRENWLRRLSAGQIPQGHVVGIGHGEPAIVATEHGVTLDTIENDLLRDGIRDPQRRGCEHPEWIEVPGNPPAVWTAARGTGS